MGCTSSEKISSKEMTITIGVLGSSQKIRPTTILPNCSQRSTGFGANIGISTLGKDKKERLSMCVEASPRIVLNQLDERPVFEFLKLGPLLSVYRRLAQVF
jgi:hypothetical protein